jgi:hypothetical protein
MEFLDASLIKTVDCSRLIFCRGRGRALLNSRELRVLIKSDEGQFNMDLIKLIV